MPIGILVHCWGRLEGMRKYLFELGSHVREFVARHRGAVFLFSALFWLVWWALLGLLTILTSGMALAGEVVVYDVRVRLALVCAGLLVSSVLARVMFWIWRRHALAILIGGNLLITTAWAVLG